MIYPIVVFGNPVLKKRAEDIEQGTDLTKLVEDMFETMHAASGIGLAAPQIGKSIRLFIVDGSPMEEEDEDLKDFRKVFINAVILDEFGEEWAFEEGCLSIPTIREDVFRPETLTVRYFDENWVEHEEEYDGMRARIIQHEYDHIEGVLFTDHLPPLKKRLLKGKLQNISKGKVKADYKIAIPGK
ncbi:MAG: peptide deformylase [Cyclobacteriaceae bacterium]|nr:peptide deformylase [Cyclobacteriaceae bacterium]